jgi:hypothetical protein
MKNLDDHSETRAEEAGMAQYITDNKDRLRSEAAMNVAQKVKDVMYSHGLGNMNQPDELEILARHLAAASVEVMANKHWNKATGD